MQLRGKPLQTQPTGRASSRAQNVAETARAGSVLVAEDDPALAAMVARALRLAGYEVTVAHDGLRAAGLAAGHRFDPVLTDLEMPGLTGDRLALLLRELEPDLPIVLMTAADEPPATDGLWVSVVQKPFGIDVLLAAVAAALDIGGG
jgi:CheY-like chemotaxis protein